MSLPTAFVHQSFRFQLDEALLTSVLTSSSGGSDLDSPLLANRLEVRHICLARKIPRPPSAIPPPFE